MHCEDCGKETHCETIYLCLSCVQEGIDDLDECVTVQAATLVA